MKRSSEEEEIWRAMYSRKLSMEEGFHRLTDFHAKQDNRTRIISIVTCTVIALLLVALYLFKEARS